MREGHFKDHSFIHELRLLFFWVKTSTYIAWGFFKCNVMGYVRESLSRFFSCANMDDDWMLFWQHSFSHPCQEFFSWCFFLLHIVAKIVLQLLIFLPSQSVKYTKTSDNSESIFSPHRVLLFRRLFCSVIFSLLLLAGKKSGHNPTHCLLLWNPYGLHLLLMHYLNPYKLYHPCTAYCEGWQCCNIY